MVCQPLVLPVRASSAAPVNLCFCIIRGVRHDSLKRTRFRNPPDFKWISGFHLDFTWISGFHEDFTWISGFHVFFWISRLVTCF